MECYILTYANLQLLSLGFVSLFGIFRLLYTEAVHRHYTAYLDIPHFVVEKSK
jgi:hypothetical protein